MHDIHVAGGCTRDTNNMVELNAIDQLDHIPHTWLGVVVDYMRGFRNDTTDFNRPQLRAFVRHTYPAFVCGYSALIMAGALCNAYVLAIVARKRLYAVDPVYVYVANLAVTGIIECISVLPISLMVLLIQNWIFGRFLCFFLPMLQVGGDNHSLLLGIRYYITASVPRRVTQSESLVL